jgi:hypothetical protein
MNLITDDLQRIPDALTMTQPAMVIGGFAGEPSYIFAWKGRQLVDEVWWGRNDGGATSIQGTDTDTAPALAILNVYLTQTLYLAWKLAGSNAVKVLQYVLGEDGIPIAGGKWEVLPTAHGHSSEPAARTDAAPALAVGANNQLYLVWKAIGSDAPLEWSVYNGSGWSTPKVIPTARTNMPPALAARNTSGPGNVLPLCLAWADAATDGVFWSSFVPGSSSLTQNVVPDALTDAAPALTIGPGGAESYYMFWKGKGETLLSFASLNEQTAGATFTLPQLQTNLGLAAANWSGDDSGELFNDVILAWSDEKGQMWTGAWTILPNPVPAPAAGLGGGSNYILSANCRPITALTIDIEISQEIASTNGFSFQLNCYTTKGQKSAWQQYILSYLPSGSSFGCQVDNWTTTHELLNSGIQGFCPVPGPTIPAKTMLEISLAFDTTTHKVVGANFVVGLPGKTPVPHSIPLHTITTKKGGPDATLTDMSPIAAFQLDFVSLDEGATHLSIGAGTITYTASPSLTAEANFPSCIEYDEQTDETTNSVYSQLPQGSSTTFTQSFGVAIT